MEKPRLLSILSTKLQPEEDLAQAIYAQLYAAQRKRHDVVVLTDFEGRASAIDYLRVICDHFNGTFKKVIFTVQNEETFPEYAHILNRIGGKVLR